MAGGDEAAAAQQAKSAAERAVERAEKAVEEGKGERDDAKRELAQARKDRADKVTRGRLWDMLMRRETQLAERRTTLDQCEPTRACHTSCVFWGMDAYW